MPLYQFTDAETGEITRRDLVLGDDVRTLLDAGTYDVSRVEPETLSPSVTITLMATEEPEEPVAVPLAPEILLQGDGTLEVEIQDGTTVLTLSGTDIYDGEYAVASADFAAGPVNLVAPIINGTTEVGETLVATPGLWVHDSAREPFAIAGQWQRNGVDVADGTEMPFDIGTVDQGTDLTFVESATDGGGMRSSASAAVAIPAVSVIGGFVPSDLGDLIVADWDFSDRSKLFQDVAGTTPATTDGDAVRYVRDLSPRGHDLAAIARFEPGNGIVVDEGLDWNNVGLVVTDNMTGLTNSMEMFVAFDPKEDVSFLLAGFNANRAAKSFLRGSLGLPASERMGTITYLANGTEIASPTQEEISDLYSGKSVVAARGFDATLVSQWLTDFMPLRNDDPRNSADISSFRFVFTQALTTQQRADMISYLETTYNIGALA